MTGRNLRLGLIAGLLVLFLVMVPVLADSTTGITPTATEVPTATETTSTETPTDSPTETGDNSSATATPTDVPTEEATEAPVTVATTLTPETTSTVASTLFSETVTAETSASSETGSGLANTAWPKFGYDLNNTGQSPYVGAQTNTVKWTFQTGNVIEWSSALIGSDGTIYISSAFSGLDARNQNGTLKWHYNADIRSTPAISADGTIYLNSYDGVYSLVALNSDGSFKWSQNIDASYGSPTIGSDGSIYIPGMTSLYAFTRGGTQKWTYSDTNSNYFDYNTPAIGPDGTIYCTNEGGIFALDPDTGHEKWYYSTGSYIYGSPAISADGTIYAGSSDGNLYALNSDGTLERTYTLGGDVAHYGSPAISADGTIYAGSSDGNLYALNSDGTQKWYYPTGSIYGSPAIGADGTIYIGSSDGNLYALNSDKTLKWEYSIGDVIYNSPSIDSDGTVYIGSEGHKLFAFAGPSNFTSDQPTGVAPLTVQFTDTSTFSPIEWLWDFGDGDSTNATKQNPVHTYKSPGSYTVNLTITHASGTNYVVKSDYINAYAAPVADFTASSTAGATPFTVTFTDTSTNVPTEWLWDFGDGDSTNATKQNPVHTYKTSGTSSATYTVSLTATNAAGSHTASKAGYITLLSSAPVVSFIASPRVSGASPLTVQFNDTSTLSPTEWLWDFGDGDSTNATVQNPVHTYSNFGSYTVKLTATNAIGPSTVSKTSFINILKPGALASNGANIYVANDIGVKYDFNGTRPYVPNTYYIGMTGGLNALGIYDGTDERIVQTRNQSGTFWASFGGGQPTMHEGILMLAVNGTIPDDFSLHIKSSGYNWTLDTTSPLDGNADAPTVYNYVDGAVDETFTKSDFIYGPQSWKPCSIASYPIYGGEDQSDPINQFQIMFIDLNAGAIGSLPDGKIKIEYSFNNLTSFAVFNDYGWYSKSNHGTGIVMTNDVSKSGYQVTGIPAAPIADVSFSTNTSDILSPVQFTDTSANVPQSWYWEFGDGNTSTVQNPTYTYNTPGTYTVNLTVMNIKGTDKIVKTNLITKVISAVPSAAFTANATSGVSPVPVQFTDKSTGTIFSWYWDFGDGTNATSQNPVHWYSPGTYSVNLTVTNSGGNNSTLKTSYIAVSSNGLTNQFVNPGFEIGSLTGWTAGNTNAGVSSDYAHTGTYALYTGISGTSIEQYIDLTGISNISFWNYRPVTGYGPVFRVYVDGSLISSSYDSTDTWIQKVIPISGYSGVHLVKIAYSAESTGKGAYMDDISTTIGSSSGTTAPTATFTATPVNGAAPLAVKFTDATTGSPTSWLWDFGDNETSDQQNVTHTYTAVGTYTVNLTVTNAAGSNSTVKTDYITVTAPAAPDLTVSTLASNNGEVFSASGNTYTAKVTNIGDAAAGAFAVGFNVSGTTGTVSVSDGIAAGANVTLTWTDETVRAAGDVVTITVTADAENSVAESNEANNNLTIDKTVVHNGYRGKRWTGGDDLNTVKTYDVRGDLLWSAGDSAYLSAATNWIDYTVNWTAGDLAVPENATIAAARLYVPYTEDKGPVFPENVSLTFNGVAVEQAACYDDEKMWGSSYPYGMTVYDVAGQFSKDGNAAALTSTFPGGGNVSVRGMLLAVVYDDGTAAPHTVLINEGFDLIYGGASQGSTPEQATAYAPFAAVESGATGARLITVAPGSGPSEAELIFNGETWTNVWNYAGTSQIGVDERNVTSFLAGENTAAFQSSGDYMEAAAAFLVVEYPLPTGSIAVASTPAGAAVWLDGTDTGLVTPTAIADVPADDHVVTLKLEGYADASTPVTVASGETATVDLALTTLTGSLAVTSTPTGAAIFIDGADTGAVTDATLDGIAVGTHTVTLQLAGYRDATADVTIAYNETAALHVDLTETAGSIAVSSTPTGAAILLDGAETGKTTDAVLTNVPAGEHTVTVTKAGYADASTTVTVADNETATVAFTLTEPSGSIAVSSSPDGARIFLDGAETGEQTDTTLTHVPVGTHTVRVELDGYHDAEETVTVAAGQTAEASFTLEASAIVLHPGWNFVSTPKRLAAGQNTFALFDEVDTAGHSILYYDSEIDRWEAMRPVDAFVPLDGIWIYSNSTYTVPLGFATGSAQTPPVKSLYTGWNAIGFTDTVPETAADTLLSVKGAWTTLFGFDAKAQAYDVSIIRGATGRHGDDRMMTPMQGYWLFMDTADTLCAIGA